MQQPPEAAQPQRIATALAAGISALDGPTADMVLGNCFPFLVEQHTHLSSKRNWSRSVAGHPRAGEESLRGYPHDCPELLEDSEELHRGQVQEG